jgi:hypothetical protein
LRRTKPIPPRAIVASRFPRMYDPKQSRTSIKPGLKKVVKCPIGVIVKMGDLEASLRKYPQRMPIHRRLCYVGPTCRLPIVKRCLRVRLIAHMGQEPTRELKSKKTL